MRKGASRSVRSKISTDSSLSAATPRSAGKPSSSSVSSSSKKYLWSVVSQPW